MKHLWAYHLLHHLHESRNIIAVPKLQLQLPPTPSNEVLALTKTKNANNIQQFNMLYKARDKSNTIVTLTAIS